MTNMAPMSFIRIRGRIEHKSEPGLDICLAMPGDQATNPKASDLEPL